MNRITTHEVGPQTDAPADVMDALKLQLTRCTATQIAHQALWRGQNKYAGNQKKWDETQEILDALLDKWADEVMTLTDMMVKAGVSRVEIPAWYAVLLPMPGSNFRSVYAHIEPKSGGA